MANTKTTKTGRTTSSTAGTTRGTNSSVSTTRNVLDAALRDQLLAGLGGMMTDEQLEAYARSLLAPQLSAGIEGAQQTYEAARLAGEAEIDDLAAALTQAVGAQHAAYRQSMADVETAALARGMGRSSYTLQTLAAQGDALARAVQSLTQESERRQAQQRAKIAQAAQHSTQTKARLESDFAANLAAKLQELREDQRREYNQHYMTATSAALGRQTQTTGTSSSQSSSTQTTNTSSTGTTREIQPIFRTVGVPAQTGGTSSSSSSSSSSKKKKQEETTETTAAKPSAPQTTGGGGGRTTAVRMVR